MLVIDAAAVIIPILLIPFLTPSKTRHVSVADDSAA